MLGVRDPPGLFLMIMKKLDILNRIKNYLSDIRSELKKVTWPTWDDVKKTTLAVIVLSVIFGVYLRFVDYAFRYMVDRVIGFFK
jgi:preprotein translocase subunit SecE